MQIHNSYLVQKEKFAKLLEGEIEEGERYRVPSWTPPRLTFVLPWIRDAIHIK